VNSVGYRTLLISSLGLALVSSGVALYFFERACRANICNGPAGSPFVLFSLYSISASTAVAAWLLLGFTGVVFWRSRSYRYVWKKAGFDRNVYNLMVKMRGGNSRLELLRHLESPKQRNELSQVTGIDWKEVDREVSLLQSYGLVSVYAETGSVKIFKLTEQGQLLLKLIGELNQ